MNLVQHKVNKEYNRYLLKLIEWNYLYKKVIDEIEQGLKPIKTIEKLTSLEVYIEQSLNIIQNLSKSANNYSDLVDDQALIALFITKQKERKMV